MENIVLKSKELRALIGQADKALHGNSNDAEHDALYSIRERLAEFSQDPNRRRREQTVNRLWLGIYHHRHGEDYLLFDHEPTTEEMIEAWKNSYEPERGEEEWFESYPLKQV
jgi:hypothetical protein